MGEREYTLNDIAKGMIAMNDNVAVLKSMLDVLIEEVNWSPKKINELEGLIRDGR